MGPLDALSTDRKTGSLSSAVLALHITFARQAFSATVVLARRFTPTLANTISVAHHPNCEVLFERSRLEDPPE